MKTLKGLEILGINKLQNGSTGKAKKTSFFFGNLMNAFMQNSQTKKLTQGGILSGNRIILKAKSTNTKSIATESKPAIRPKATEANSLASFVKSVKTTPAKQNVQDLLQIPEASEQKILSALFTAHQQLNGLKNSNILPKQNITDDVGTDPQVERM